MTDLFLRDAYVKVGVQGTSEGLKFNTRIAFEIEKTQSATSNKAKISVYNLNPDSQAYLEQPLLQVELYAGYGDDIQLLFVGDVKRVNRTRSGPDVLSVIECGDGEKLIEESTFEQSFAAGTTNIQVLYAAIAAFGVTIGMIQDLEPTVFIGGFAYSGQVKNLMTSLCKDQGLTWSIQDNELIIKAKGTATPEEGPLITQDTGLIGTPTKTEKGLKFKSLLNPQLRPGRYCVVKTLQYVNDFLDQGPINLSPKEALEKAASGTFIVDKVKHAGDTNSGDFSSEVEAILPGTD